MNNIKKMGTAEGKHGLVALKVGTAVNITNTA